MKRTITTLLVAGTFGSAAVLGTAYFGLVNVGADDPHFPAVHSFLAMARDRSIEVRARDIEVPDLKNAALIKAGAGNYNAMCIGCHLAPGVGQTELSQALYPSPPDLTKVGVGGDPAAAFWTIKHGIKATGMPAWGKSMGDEYIWGIVAFLNQLPQINPEQYKALVATSGGHKHGGGESDMHNHEGQHGVSSRAEHGDHDEAADDDHAQAAHDHGTAPAGSAQAADHHGDHNAAEAHSDPHPASSPKTHVHKDGKEHTHAN
ncbi:MULTISPECIES: cytochrome c [Pseudomonas]|jgi:mono/diheme cytochrome c family protein|uniref:Cytochrome c n=1 Tax=Pseudomonas helleri TaxID=1608996 RepID=A0A7X1Y6W2_9PSED|nr:MULTISPECIES: cytochrome c [Pseudomonas]AOA07535.1 cystathionine gamma-lyase [Pseudomonas sp. TMW 2.1634]MBF8744515.1 cytochrome c [Pseudomonas monteilii]MBM1199767.1 cytochrome c [Pseudomonas fragi]MBM1204964.1 cytochrome c [Pseudomonas fragi]MCO7623566.1 cytochrome c [Pseudomonas guariconensis]